MRRPWTGLAGIAAAAMLAVVTAPGAAGADDAIAGVAPTYAGRALSDPPNAAAMRSRMWVPEIDLGFVPQGLTVADGAVILAAYGYGAAAPAKCRLYRIDRARLAVTGRYDLPADCGHAGCLAYAGGGRLFVADTWRLYEVDMARAFDPTLAGTALVRSLSLRFPLRGSFLAHRGDALWIGEYKRPGPGEIHELPLTAVEAAAEPAGLGPEHVRRSFPVAPKSQGAAFDADGFLWLSQSNSQEGALQKVDPATGAVLAGYEAVAGIEDLGFDADGMLWSVSEAGSRRWHNWPTYFPVLFSIDVGALR